MKGIMARLRLREYDSRVGPDPMINERPFEPLEGAEEKMPLTATYFVIGVMALALRAPQRDFREIPIPDGVATPQGKNPFHIRQGANLGFQGGVILSRRSRRRHRPRRVRSRWLGAKGVPAKAKAQSKSGCDQDRAIGLHGGRPN